MNMNLKLLYVNDIKMSMIQRWE